MNNNQSSKRQNRSPNKSPAAKSVLARGAIKNQKSGKLSRVQTAQSSKLAQMETNQNKEEGVDGARSVSPTQKSGGFASTILCRSSRQRSSSEQDFDPKKLNKSGKLNQSMAANAQVFDEEYIQDKTFMVHLADSAGDIAQAIIYLEELL